MSRRIDANAKILCKYEISWIRILRYDSHMIHNTILNFRRDINKKRTRRTDLLCSPAPNIITNYEISRHLPLFSVNLLSLIFLLFECLTNYIFNFHDKSWQKYFFPFDIFALYMSRRENGKPPAKTGNQLIDRCFPFWQAVSGNLRSQSEAKMRNSAKMRERGHI